MGRTDYFFGIKNNINQSFDQKYLYNIFYSMNSFPTFFFTPYVQPNVSFCNFSPYEYCYYMGPALNLEKSTNPTE